MKNKILVLLISIMVFTATGCGCENKNKVIEEPKVEQNESSIEEQVKNETKEEQNGMKISNIKIKEYGASNIVTGKVKNIRNQTRNINLTLKMYDSKTNRLLGKVTTEIKGIKGNEEKEFEISIMGDYTKVDKFEVEVKDM